MISDKLKFIFRKREAFRAVFRRNLAVDIVLADLGKFCRAHATPAAVSPMTGMIDPIATGIAIGRLEVWHRITQNLHISDADLHRIAELEADQERNHMESR